MSKQPVTLLELKEDMWAPDLEPLVRVPKMAGELHNAIIAPEVWEWVRESPLSELDRTRLRWVLCVLRRSRPFEPEPVRTALTWRERITGRLSRDG